MRSPGERLIHAGLVMTALGMAAALVAMLPLVADVVLPSWMWALSMLTGIGFLLVCLGLIAKGRHRSRAQRAVRSVPQ